MTIPGWLLDAFAALMLLVAAVSAARLGAARAGRGSAAGQSADVDAAHLLMGIAMAGMLTSSLTTLPAGAWEAVFAVLTAWFGGRVIADARSQGAGALAAGHYLPHLIHSAAMIYMFAALTAPGTGGGTGGMAGMGAGSTGMGTLAVPTVALVFAFALAGYAVWDLDQLASPLSRARLWPAFPAAPAPAAALIAGGPPAAPVAGPVPLADARALVLAPGVAIGARIAMGITMAFMLIILI